MQSLPTKAKFPKNSSGTLGFHRKKRENALIDQQIRVSPKLTIGPQIDEEGLKQLADQGFKAIVNLSGKGEFDQIFAPKEEGELVEELGMEYIHAPLTLRRISPEDLDTICQEVASVDGPVYMHCLRGQRSSVAGLIFHAIRRGFTTKTIRRRANKLGITWKAPYLQDVVRKYIERTRPIREEILASA